MVDVVDVYRLSKKAFLPRKGTTLSACYDIRACLWQETVKFHGMSTPIEVEKFGTPDAFIRLYPDDMALIPTGLIFLLPETDHLKMYSRSGNVWKRLLCVANAPAVIDADYTHETFVLLRNLSEFPLYIQTGDAIAQCELCPNVDVEFGSVNNSIFSTFCDDLKKNSNRDGGLGSTGK